MSEPWMGGVYLLHVERGGQMWCQLKEQAVCFWKLLFCRWFLLANSYPDKTICFGGVPFIIKTAEAIKSHHHHHVGTQPCAWPVSQREYGFVGTVPLGFAGSGRDECGLLLGAAEGKERRNNNSEAVVEPSWAAGAPLAGAGKVCPASRHIWYHKQFCLLMRSTALVTDCRDWMLPGNTTNIKKTDFFKQANTLLLLSPCPDLCFTPWRCAFLLLSFVAYRYVDPSWGSQTSLGHQPHSLAPKNSNTNTVCFAFQVVKVFFACLS